MKLDRIYRDVYSKLNLEGTDHKVYPADIINTINDSIRLLRAEYTRRGLGSNFTVTDDINSFQESEYEYLNKADLSRTIIDEVSTESSVLTSLVYLYGQEIPNAPASFQKGDMAVKGDFVYEATENINNRNTYDATFEWEDVRNFSEFNGLKYNQGDVLFTDEDYIINFGDKIYWLNRGKAFVVASHYPLRNLINMVLFKKNVDHSVISVNSNSVYVLPEIKRVVLSYIPKWEDITDLETELNIPEFIVPNVIAESVNRLRSKLFGTFERRQNLEDTEEDDE